MYAGRIVERAPVTELFSNPLHAYTKGLLASMPRLDSVRKSELPTIPVKLLQSMNSLLVADFVNEWRGLWRIVIIGQLIKKLALGILLKIALSVSKGLITKMNQESDNFTLLEIENLKMHFPVRGGVFGRKIGSVHAVDGVSFKIAEGSTLGLVGESGCGNHAG